MTGDFITANTDELLPAQTATNSAALARLLGDFGGDDWDIAWQDDGRLGARPRDGESRPDGPFVLFADTPAEMRTLIEAAIRTDQPEQRQDPTINLRLESLSQAIEAHLRTSGLRVTELTQSGEVAELIVTNPQRPGEDHVVIGRNGLIEWDRCHQPTDDLVVAHIAAVLIAILARD